MLVTKEKAKESYAPRQNQLHDITSRPKERVSSSSSQHRLAGNPRESLLFCILIVLLLAVSIGLVAQYSRVIAVNYQIQKVDREIAQLQEENERLTIEVKSLSSLERIENIAVNELGLQYPEHKQWLRLSSMGE